MKGAAKWFLATAGTLLVVGLLLRGVGFALGGRTESRCYFEDIWEDHDWGEGSSWGAIRIAPGEIHIGGENGIHVDGESVDIGGDRGIHVGHRSGNGHSGQELLVESGVLTGVTSIEADLDCGDIRVREGESLTLSLSWNLNNYTMRYQVENGVLKVEDESWGNAKNNQMNIKCEALLTIPAGTALDVLELSTGWGDIEVDAAVTTREADLSTELGDVVCRKLQAIELGVESELGDVTVAVPAECKGLSYSLSTDLGEVRLNGKTQKNPTVVVLSDNGYYVEAETDLGDVDLEYMG